MTLADLELLGRALIAGMEGAAIFVVAVVIVGVLGLAMDRLI